MACWEAIIRVKAGLLLTGILETNVSEINIKIWQQFSSKKLNLKMLSTKYWPFC